MTDAERKAEEFKRFRGFMAEIGAELTIWELDRGVIEMDVGDVHLNAINVVHGGVTAALIDAAGAHSSIFCTVPGNIRQAMTVSLNDIIMGNVASGRLKADARKRGGGKTICVLSCDITDEAGNLLAAGEVTCRYGRGSHLSEGTKPPRSET